MFLKRIKIILMICLTFIFSKNAAACPDIDGLVDINCDGKLQIITFGDSITRGKNDNENIRYPNNVVGYPKRLNRTYLPNATIVNLGEGGEDTGTGKKRAAQKFRAYTESDYTMILEGTNDYYKSGRTSANTKSNLLSIERSASSTGSKTLISSLTEVNRSRARSQSTWVSAVNNAIKNETEVNFYSLGRTILSSDGLHPNGTGYQKMAEVAYNSLKSQSSRARPSDSDNDGLYNWEEVNRRNTDPFNPDSDSDGLTDGAEIFQYFTNPNNPDSDGDGLSD
nr:SGNH/GDSL hydrolase family protein [Pseudomonadota bacterium]